MSNYIISYNPYQNTTKIVKNGTALRKNSAICKGVDGKRLQTWFDVDRAWEGFGRAIDVDNNESECNIDFVGREIDFLDLKDYFETVYISERNTTFHLNSKFLSNDEDLLSKLLVFVDNAKNDGIFEPTQLESIEKYIDQIKSTPFVISVIATMSSGKSTLLNSLMHMELLPTGDDATTANIVEIYDNDKSTVEYSAYDKDDNLVCEGSETDLSILSEINSNSSVRTVKIYTNIPSVTIEKMQLMLRDTPGPNNSQDLQHKQITESIISDAKNMSTVIYVMNATQLRVDSDKELLSNIAYEMKEGGKQANDRFLFVINKVDLRLRKKEQTLEGLIEDTKNYLSQFGIENPRIFPITAGLACDVWKCRSGYEFDELTEWPDVDKNLKMFNVDSPRVKFDLYSSLSPCVRKQLDDDLENAIEKEDIHEVALIHSGVKGLEYSIREYMEKYAYPIKVSDAVKDIIETIDEKKMRSKFMDVLLEDERKLEEARKKIGSIEQKKAERLAAKEEFEKGINDYSLPQSIKEDARQSVDDAFADLIDSTLDKLPSSKLKKDEAISIVSSLTTDTENIEKKLDKKIKDMVNESVYQKGEQILNAYQEYIRLLKEELNIENFDFGKVKSLKGYDFQDLKDVARRVTSTENITKKKTDYVPNPDRHWYTPWRPKTIPKESVEIVGTIEYVDKSAVRDDIISIRTNAHKNVDEIVNDASKLVESFKTFFMQQLQEFDKVINKVIEELSLAISEEKIAENTREQHENNLDKLSEYIELLNGITNIEEE